jgi:hypothetical protein
MAVHKAFFLKCLAVAILARCNPPVAVVASGAPDAVHHWRTEDDAG